jgi:hypothetical protein
MSWRPHWTTQALSGSGRMPAISTRRVARSITNRTPKRASPPGVQSSTVKKSAAARTSRCVLRNSCQVVRFCRSGAVSFAKSPSSENGTQQARGNGLRLTDELPSQIRRPRGDLKRSRRWQSRYARLFRVQNSRRPPRCQAMTVAGSTMTTADWPQPILRPKIYLSAVGARTGSKAFG